VPQNLPDTSINFRAIMMKSFPHGINSPYLVGFYYYFQQHTCGIGFLGRNTVKYFTHISLKSKIVGNIFHIVPGW